MGGTAYLSSSEGHGTEIKAIFPLSTFSLPAFSV